MSGDGPPPDKLSIVVFSGHYDKVHYALVMASAAAAVSRPVTLFFTMGACHALRAAGDDAKLAWCDLPLSEEEGTGGDKDDAYAAMKVATFEELLQYFFQMGVTFMVCEMGLRAVGLEDAPLRDDIPLEVGGVVTFLVDASKDGAMIFI